MVSKQKGRLRSRTLATIVTPRHEECCVKLLSMDSGSAAFLHRLKLSGLKIKGPGAMVLNHRPGPGLSNYASDSPLREGIPLLLR